MNPTLDWSNSLDYVAVTDVGMRRANNQDANAVMLAADADDWRRRGHVFVVADGMGAHAAGELASKLAADGIPHTYHKLRELSAPDAIRQSFHEINAHIHRRGQANHEFQGMGTTASVLLLLPQGAITAQVGDSRVYRLRGNRLEQLTFDHSLVWEMSAAGQVPKDALPNFVPKNIITRSLGPHPDVKIDLEGPFPLELGDRFLLCSDGLTGQLNDSEIGVILGLLEPAEAAQVLIDLANLRGGPDNITVIVARVTGEGITSAANPQVEPLTISAETPRVAPQRKPMRLLWLLTAAGLIAAVALAALDLQIPAVACALAAVILAALSLLLRVAPSGPTSYLAPGAHLGHGPHVTCDCQPDERFANDLAQLSEQLRNAAKSKDWVIDWSRFNAGCQRGKASAESGDWPTAVREYSLALRSIMSDLRSMRGKRKLGEGEIDLLSS